MVGASGQKPYYLVRPKAGQNPIAAIEEALAAMESAAGSGGWELKESSMLFTLLPVDFFHCGVVE